MFVSRRDVKKEIREMVGVDGRCAGLRGGRGEEEHRMTVMKCAGDHRRADLRYTIHAKALEVGDMRTI
jgi:hypothetical protein